VGPLDQPEVAAPKDAQPPSVDEGEVVIRITPTLRVGLSREECWQLYDGLGDQAPFVRNQLRAIRNGRTADVSLTTAQEHCEVLEAIEIGGGGGRSLTSGLLSLKLALTSDNPVAVRGKK
jgi:hypothetical protein